jgi:glycosyltransferase involved in cell wall biosynthesis
MMRVGLIHNEYGVFSGEEAMFYQIADLLRSRGHNVSIFCKSSNTINDSWIGKCNAFFSGIYRGTSRREIRQMIQAFRPDIIQVQNLYPLISPSVLLEIREHGIPIVMRCANYRLVCPNGLFLREGKVCQKCVGGREYWCALTNCQGSMGKSIGYALRNYAARIGRWYLDTIDAFYTQTEFQKQILIQNGYDSTKISTIPNMVEMQTEITHSKGLFVGYVGRISKEKGIDVLLDSARLAGSIPFKIAGTLTQDYYPVQFPQNIQYQGIIPKKQIGAFMGQSRFTVVPSICYEGFPSTILESMVHGKPVICSAIGGLGEIVQDGKTGLLFEPGNAKQLAEKIVMLWNNPDLCRQMGYQAQITVRKQYSKDLYYERLMNLYQQVTQNRLLQNAIPEIRTNPPLKQEQAGIHADCC